MNEAAANVPESQPRGPFDPKRPATGDSVRAAVLIVAAFVTGTIVLPAALSQGIALIAVGPLQLVWAVPMAIYAKIAKRPRLFKVTLIGAGIVFLLNVTCTAIVFSTMRFGG